MITPNPKRIGKYEVIELLGRGGMGMVYRAFDRQLNREVAIKTVTEGFTGDNEMLERFYHEAAKTAALKHPNIVVVYDLGEQDGFPYIVMEYLSGEPLDKFIQSRRQVPLAFKLRIIAQVCSALGYAHRNYVIHRDVKPGNVIVEQDGVAKLLDFGIARQEKYDGHLTRTGHVIGTVQYMAPERLKNEVFDGRSDIFSTGIMLYQVLTGQLPFTGDYNIVQRLLTENHPPLSNYLHEYPAALDSILDRSLAKNPDDRFSSAEEMGSELSALAEELKQEQVTEWMQQAQRFVQEEQYSTARDILLQVLKADSQHITARQLMVVVQQNLSSRQRVEQIRQLRLQADDAISNKRFEEAIGHLQEACRLDPANSELAAMLNAARVSKKRREQVDICLQQAESAGSRGDFENAQSVLSRAMELDNTDSRVRAAHVALVRQIEESARQAKTRKILDSARNEIDARHFTAALDLLAEVEKVDPSNPSLISLLVAAKSGREQEQRRRVLEQLQNEISLASTADDLNRAIEHVNRALERMPSEPTLLKFRAQLSRQLREDEVRRRVDEVAQRCRGMLETSPRDALKLVRQELQDTPGNERLLALQSSLEGHVSEQTKEQSRADYLTRAHEALSSGNYEEALRLLESCQAEGVFSSEVGELMDLARQELEQQRKDTQAQSLLRQAQELMTRGEYEAVIKLLSPVSGDPSFGSLLLVLQDAKRRYQAFQNDVDGCLQKAQALTSAEHYDEALAFLQSLPATIQQSPAMQNAILRLQETQKEEYSALLAVGKAYAALDRSDILNEAVPSSKSGDVSFLSRIAPVYASRRKSFADRQLGLAIEQGRAALDAGDGNRAAELLRSADMFSEFASAELQSEYQALSKRVGKSKVLGRFGIRK